MPPRVDANGYGLRVRALVISPYAKSGYIDHQTLSFDAYSSSSRTTSSAAQRLDPAPTAGRPAADVRENAPILGDLAHDFDFTQKPRPRCSFRCTPAPPRSLRFRG